MSYVRWESVWEFILLMKRRRSICPWGGAWVVTLSRWVHIHISINTSLMCTVIIGFSRLRLLSLSTICTVWDANAIIVENYYSIHIIRLQQFPQLYKIMDKMINNRANIDTLKSKCNDRHFAYIFKCVFSRESLSIWIQISIKSFSSSPIYSKTSLVLGLAWCRTSYKPLSEPMMTQSTGAYHICHIVWVPGHWCYCMYQQFSSSMFFKYMFNHYDHNPEAVLRDVLPYV